MDLLRVEDLRVSVSGKEILRGLNLSLGRNEVHVLMGPNGAGKSTLLNAIMGLPRFKVDSGRIIFDGRDITKLEPHERARLGIAMMFQNPPKLRGVRLRELARKLEELYGSTHDDLDLRIDYLMDRSLYDGFSGGETKRVELFLTYLQRPKLALLDEPDSGVDVENLCLVGRSINKLVEKGSSVLVVTHQGHILAHLERVDYIHVLVDGRICLSSDNPKDVISLILEHGYEKAMKLLNEKEGVERKC